MQIVTRFDLDRPLLLKEKFDVMIGKDSDNSTTVTSNIRKKLDKLKHKRKVENIYFREIYTMMLNYIKERTIRS
jgi:hypothetical protein